MLKADKNKILLIYGTLLVIVAGDTCPYKECDCSGNIIHCNDKGLAAMPNLSSVEGATFLSLYLDTNQITYIPAGSLPVGLVQISLVNNPITTIDDYALGSVSTTLEYLSFKKSKFLVIPNAFLRLDALKHLSITDTMIFDWNVGAMAHIGQTLETLNLDNVGLNKWPVWIEFCYHLDELSITNNIISSIPDNAFDNLASNLMTLTLFNNSLTSVPKSLSKLEVVVTLDLQRNRISDLTWLPASDRLSELSLNNNNISDSNHLSDSLQNYSDSLSYVSLSYNKLKVIPNLSFLKNIGSFDLSHNLISDPDSGSAPTHIYDFDLTFNLLRYVPRIYMTLPTVKFLNLSHNSISELHGTDIPLWIRDVDFSYNLITELTDYSFPNNSIIENLYLNNNPLTNISIIAFKSLPALFSLNLQGTLLTRVPLSLAFLTNLYILDLSNCPHLVCTCQEKHIANRLMALVELSGSCGAISIANFFSTLSLTCP